jgi:hypothetical protein
MPFKGWTIIRQRGVLAAMDKRLAELEKLVVSAYEDKVKGIMPEALCVQLMNRLLQIFSFRRTLILSYKFAIFFP